MVKKNPEKIILNYTKKKNRQNKIDVYLFKFFSRS